MKRFPLQTLLKLRAHRTESARLLLLARQREVESCRRACQAICAEIAALATERAAQQQRLLTMPAGGMDWAQSLAQRDAHLVHLAAVADDARERLLHAQSVLANADAALESARAGYFKARARQDAIERRRDAWYCDQTHVALRREEVAVAELLQSIGVRETMR